MQYPVSVRPGRWLMIGFMIALSALVVGCQKQEFARADGPKLNWDNLRNQWVLVNYWAEWCKPCREEIPELNNLDKAPDIAVLGVNFDGVAGAELSDVGARMGIEYTMLSEDPGKRFGWETPIALPATFIVNPDGELVEVRFGPQTEADIRSLIGG